jgi:3-hydroxybutyryl-CoA dehydrogenase
MSIKTVRVLGCGLMGAGIAQTCAAAGYLTIVRDVSDGAVQKGIDRVRVFVDNGVSGSV